MTGKTERNEDESNGILRDTKLQKLETTKLRKLGFCGADDSVSPLMLGLICQSYPFVEFGVLFRPDKEGNPRYATKEWVERLGKVASVMW